MHVHRDGLVEAVLEDGAEIKHSTETNTNDIGRQPHIIVDCRDNHSTDYVRFHHEC